jgi:hypothetical protein
MQSIAPRARPAEIRSTLQRENRVVIAFTSVRPALGQLANGGVVEQAADSKTCRIHEMRLARVRHGKHLSARDSLINDADDDRGVALHGSTRCCRGAWLRVLRPGAGAATSGGEMGVTPLSVIGSIDCRATGQDSTPGHKFGYFPDPPEPCLHVACTGAIHRPLGREPGMAASSFRLMTRAALVRIRHVPSLRMPLSAIPTAWSAQN